MKLAKFTFTITLSLISISAFAELNIPRVINFQSVLRDDAGNLIATDTTSLEFRILDADGTQLYFESQAEVPVTRGAVNAMIGEGNIPGTSTPTGGIPLNALDPTTGEKLLQYRIGSGEPVDPIELSLIPYAFWSEKSLGVVNNSIGSDQIRNGSIKLEDLEAGTISFNDVSGMIGVTQIPPSIARHSEITNHETSPTAHQASSIIVQGPLPRLPAAVNNVQNALSELASLLSNEISQRQTTRDTFTESLNTLMTNLSSEASTRASADGALATAISTKVSKSGDTMDGSLTMNGNIVMQPGRTVDGVDVSNMQLQIDGHEGRIRSLENSATIEDSEIPSTITRDNEVPRLAAFAFASFVGISESLVILPPVSAHNISSLTDMGACSASLSTADAPFSVRGRRYRVPFSSPASTANYVVMVSGHDGSAYSPVIMEKTGAYFDVCELVHGLDPVSSYAKFDVLVFKP